MNLLPTLLSALILIMFCIQAGACRSSGATSSVPTPPAGSYTTGLFEVTYGTTTLHASGASVSPEFFPGVSARPLLGRLFLPEEYLAGKQGVVILSHRLWQQRLGGNPSVIGAVLQIGGKSYTIVGVMPLSFEIPGGAEIWAVRTENSIFAMKSPFSDDAAPPGKPPPGDDSYLWSIAHNSESAPV